MQFDIRVADTDATKAVKTAWAAGDKIYVFFSGLGAKYLTLSCDGSSWINTSGGGTLEDTDFEGLNPQMLTAVHFPVAVDVAYADGKFTFTSDGKPVYTYYLSETGKDYIVDGTTVTATLSLTKPADMVQMHVAGIQDNVADYTFGCSKIKPVACASVGTDGAITESALQAGARLSGFADADGGIFSGRLVYPGLEKDYKFTLASDTQLYTLIRSGKALIAGAMYTFPALSETGDTKWTVQNASELYVDLGIEVDGKKIYWAKCNLGAESETEYGDYFAWGELLPYYQEGHSQDNPCNDWIAGKSGGYKWANYAWGSAREALTKYCGDAAYGKDGFTDALTTLEKEDDAAYAALGGKFRMPTLAEIEALVATWGYMATNYTWTWCDTGVKGFEIKNNTSEVTLFLPAAGHRDAIDFSGDGTFGYYWSSSLNPDEPDYAYVLDFSLNIGAGWGWVYRTYGQSVRPVYSE